jgi:hypothetical protein
MRVNPATPRNYCVASSILMTRAALRTGSLIAEQKCAGMSRRDAWWCGILVAWGNLAEEIPLSQRTFREFSRGACTAAGSRSWSKSAVSLSFDARRARLLAGVALVGMAALAFVPSPALAADGDGGAGSAAQPGGGGAFGAGGANGQNGGPGGNATSAGFGGGGGGGGGTGGVTTGGGGGNGSNGIGGFGAGSIGGSTGVANTGAGGGGGGNGGGVQINDSAPAVSFTVNDSAEVSPLASPCRSRPSIALRANWVWSACEFCRLA